MRFTSKVRTFMEHNRLLKRYVESLKESGLVRTLHHIDIVKSKKMKKEELSQFQSFYEKNMEKFKETYELLADVESKNTYKAIINFRRTWNYKVLEKHIHYPQYFVKEIFDSYDNEVFVDGGAYIGDTVEKLLKISGGVYARFMHGNLMKEMGGHCL